MLQIYNTLTRRKEKFETLEPGQVKMYVCGPTVYDRAHVGHAMSALVFDIIRRYLQFRGFEVRYVMNFTDVDDKIIERANRDEIDPFVLAERLILDYSEHLRDLNILPATAHPRATQTMDSIIAMISGLVGKGYAYPAGGDVYFRVRKDARYGRLSGRRLEDMQAGARIEVSEQKEDPLDFALWKAAKPGEPAWDSPWGKGRPGWHIECSAMNLAIFGEQIDIHGGGNDLIFPHHENEIAQSECLTGKDFARYWMHNGMLQLGGEKMSKSLGNLVSIEDFLRDHDADVMRMLVLAGSYRAPLAFTDEAIRSAEGSLDRLRGGLKPALPGAAGAGADLNRNLENQTADAPARFTTAMDDDFNTAGALSALYELVRAINQARDAGATRLEMEPAQTELRRLASVLGLSLGSRQGSAEADRFIDLLVDLRTELRNQKQWALSDLVRDRLASLGVSLEDSKQGTTWHW